MISHFITTLAASGDVDAIRINFNDNSRLILRIVIATILFGIALGTTIDDFKAAVRMPKAISVGVLAQFILLPAITFVLTLILGVQGSVALGMILVACCPPRQRVEHHDPSGRR